VHVSGCVCMLKTYVNETATAHIKLLVFESQEKMCFFPQYLIICELVNLCHLSFFHSLRYNFNSFETALSTAEVSRQMVLFYSSVRHCVARGVEAAPERATERAHTKLIRAAKAHTGELKQLRQLAPPGLMKY
jgi:hypothetical protein